MAAKALTSSTYMASYTCVSCEKDLAKAPTESVTPMLVPFSWKEQQKAAQLIINVFKVSERAKTRLTKKLQSQLDLPVLAFLRSERLTVGSSEQIRSSASSACLFMLSRAYISSSASVVKSLTGSMKHNNGLENTSEEY